MTMKLAEKIKTVSVKCQPPRYSRRELLEKTQVGMNPKYRIPVEAIGRSLKDSAASRRHYGKGWARMKGWCLTCEHFKGKEVPGGQHCKLKELEHCVK